MVARRGIVFSLQINCGAICSCHNIKLLSYMVWQPVSVSHSSVMRWITGYSVVFSALLCFCLLKAMVEAWPRLEKHDQRVTSAIPAAYATHLSNYVCVCVFACTSVCILIIRCHLKNKAQKYLWGCCWGISAMCQRGNSLNGVIV